MNTRPQRPDNKTAEALQNGSDPNRGGHRLHPTQSAGPAMVSQTPDDSGGRATEDTTTRATVAQPTEAEPFCKASTNQGASQ